MHSVYDPRVFVENIRKRRSCGTYNSIISCDDSKERLERNSIFCLINRACVCGHYGRIEHFDNIRFNVWRPDVIRTRPVSRCMTIYRKRPNVSTNYAQYRHGCMGRFVWHFDGDTAIAGKFHCDTARAVESTTKIGNVRFTFMVISQSSVAWRTERAGRVK